MRMYTLGERDSLSVHQRFGLGCVSGAVAHAVFYPLEVSQWHSRSEFLTVRCLFVKCLLMKVCSCHICHHLYLEGELLQIISHAITSNTQAIILEVIKSYSFFFRTQLTHWEISISYYFLIYFTTQAGCNNIKSKCGCKLGV